jgi:hypothetical protein
MKNKTKIRFLVLTLIPFISACQGTLVGTAEKGSSCTQPAEYTRIIIPEDNKTGCSGTNGAYSITDLNVNQNKKVIYRKQNYKIKELYVNIEDRDDNTVSPANADCLESADTSKEIYGTVTWNRPDPPKNITLKLYRLECGDWTEIENYTVNTCNDGKYGFPDLDDLTFKVEASYPGCTFTPTCESKTRGSICNFQGTCQGY